MDALVFASLEIEFEPRIVGAIPTGPSSPAARDPTFPSQTSRLSMNIFNSSFFISARKA